MKQVRASSVDEYIDAFPAEVRDKLIAIRAAIQEEAPEAREGISYGIPTFKFHGNLVHFAAFGKHIGFYPASSGIKAFKKELSRYETSTGTVRFPLDKPLPLALIRKIVRFRVKDNMSRLKTKAAPARKARKARGA